MVQSNDMFPALNEYEADEYDGLDELKNLFERAKGEVSKLADEVDEHIDRVREAEDILRRSPEFDNQSHPEFFESIDEGVDGMKNMKQRYEEVEEYQFSGESSPENSELDESEFIHIVMDELKLYAERFEILEDEIRSLIVDTDNLKEVQSVLTQVVFDNEKGSSYDGSELSKKDISISDVSELDDIREEHEKALRYAMYLEGYSYEPVKAENIGEVLAEIAEKSAYQAEEVSGTDVPNEDIADSLTAENTE